MTQAQKRKQEQLRLAEFEQLCMILDRRNVEAVAAAARVHYTTLYKWLDGTTKTPHLATYIRVANALGYRLKLTKVRG